MKDETNQMMESLEAELPERLFDDYDEDIEPAAETEAKAESASEDSKTESEAERKDEKEASGAENHSEAETKTDNAQTIRVKFNGEERDLSLEEARTLAQKGMNYDHVIEERDRNRQAFDFLMERAKANNMTVEELIEREKNNAANQRIEKKIAELRERDEDASEETLKMLATRDIEAEDRLAEEAKQAEIKNKEEEMINGWRELFKIHPELKPTDGKETIPKEMFDLVGEGYSPVAAHYVLKLREIEEENKIKEAAETAKNKSIGSLSGVQSGKEEDDFLAGFNSF